MVIEMEIENPYQQYMYSYPHKTAYGPLHNINLREYAGKLEGKENSLYFHIPFCQYKCGYCNLFSVTGQNEQWMQRYIDAMERQAVQLSEILSSGVEFADLTFGGGTPLILPLPLLRRVFSIAKSYFRFGLQKYSTIVETSPNQTTTEKLELLKEESVTRLSIGVQSFQEEELKTLHRFHSTASAKEALRLIKKARFDCLNIDLIYGIPGQTKESLLDSLEQALEFEPQELFVYPLYVKPDTALFQQGVKQSKQAFEMYWQMRDFLKSAGYQQHSMRRFVKSAQPCPPETLCGFGNTLSVGCGGRSYIDNLHFCTPYAVAQQRCLAILTDYMDTTDYLQVLHGFILPLEEQKRRYAIKHILFGRGVNREDYRKHFGADAEHDFPQLIKWEKAGYLTMGDNYITLTEDGLALSDYLGPQLISPSVRAKSEAFI